jgi:hypothetical protein
MYSHGEVFPLKYKPFFQLKPEFNVVVGDAARPFNRVCDEIREHPALYSMLQTLLEDVWEGELGNEVHIGVHPVRVRNFDGISGEIHNLMHTTFEGTHVDSTERVAVVLIDRHNIIETAPATSIYHGSCPLGLRRDVEEHERVIGPLRIFQHVLKKPFETITFDDTHFKHDASDFQAQNPNEKSWRCVMLIMCRTPVKLPSPFDGRPIDGYSPRTPRQLRNMVN